MRMTRMTLVWLVVDNEGDSMLMAGDRRRRELARCDDDLPRAAWAVSEQEQEDLPASAGLVLV